MHEARKLLKEMIDVSPTPTALSQRSKNLSIAFLLLAVCIAIYWFHGILGRDEVFTHLFYIPLILATLWWGRRGLGVVVFIAGALLFSNLFIRSSVFPLNDLLRAAIFIFTGCVMASLSERIRSAQATLKESEEKYRGLFTNARVGLFCTTIAEGRFLEANQTMADILGYDTPASLIRECLIMRCYVSPTERQSILDAALSTGEIQNVETQLFRRDRKRIWVRITGRILPEERCIEGVAVDITGIKRIQATLKRANDTMHGEHKKRKRLSRKLITTLEQSQQRLAMELHDQVGQELTTLKMDLELALKSPCQNFPDRLPCRDRMASARDKAAKTIQSIRAICSGLRPTVLEDLGLVSAISGLCEQIQAHSAIRIRFFTKNIPEHMDEEKALAVYRIAQEALTNIVRHSKANEAFVSLIRREEHLLLSIEDNGKGFERASPMGPSASPEGLGLLIMEERAVLLEGRFQQESHLGVGTQLWAEIPL